MGEQVSSIVNACRQQKDARSLSSDDGVSADSPGGPAHYDGRRVVLGNGVDPLSDCYNLPCIARGAASISNEPLSQSLRFLPKTVEGSLLDGANPDSYPTYAEAIKQLTHCQGPRRALDDWLFDAVAGRAITLLAPCPLASETNKVKLSKIPSMRYLNLSLTTLMIHPVEEDEFPSISILLDNVQAICSATESPLFRELEPVLDEPEKGRAVLLLHKVEGTGRSQVCFLEESERSKDRFIQELREIWIEKRM